jgi:hypothetical protein
MRMIIESSLILAFWGRLNETYAMFSLKLGHNLITVSEAGP